MIPYKMICYGLTMTESTAATIPSSPGRSDRDRWVALVVLCAGMLMIILDQTIVNVALPSIQDDLGFSQSSLAWVVNAYLIAFGGLLLLAGRLGDLIGRRRVFLIGLSVFTAASLLCGVAEARELLIGARFVQGVGGAMTSAVILGMIVTLFPRPDERARAIGVYSFVASAGASIGLLAGGALTQALNWHWIFFVNLPIGVATGLVAARLLERDEGIGLARGADAPGALLVVGSLMLGVYTIVAAGDHGWGSAHTLGFGALAIALLAAFAVREARTRNPLVPLGIFRSRTVSAANLVQMLMVAGLFGMFFLGALYLQRVLRFDALEVGLAFLPVALAIGTLSLGVTARVVMRFGARAALVPGLVLIALGLALFERAPVDGDYMRDLLPVMLLLGVGAGLAFPALMTLAMSGATATDSGLASGLVNTTQQVGGALGLAVLATLSTTRSDRLLAEGQPWSPRSPATTGPSTPVTSEARRRRRPTRRSESWRGRSSVPVEGDRQLVLAQRRLEALPRALGDPVDELAVDGDVAARVEALELRPLDGVLEEVEHRQVDAPQREVAAHLRDAPVQVPRVAQDGQRVLAVVLHRVEHLLERPQVGVAAVLRRLAADERLERVAHGVVVGDLRLVPLVAHHEVVQARARGRLGDEHAAARAGPCGQHAAHLEEPDRLVDRGERDPEAAAQLLLGPEPLTRAELSARDLLLELAGDRLAQRDTRAGEERFSCVGHPVASDQWGVGPRRT
jgi:EmrB/QacA subfamily drug resistance transporter